MSNVEPPCIPHLGLHQKDLIYLDTLSKRPGATMEDRMQCKQVITCRMDCEGCVSGEGDCEEYEDDGEGCVNGEVDEMRLECRCFENIG